MRFGQTCKLVIVACGLVLLTLGSAAGQTPTETTAPAANAKPAKGVRPGAAPNSTGMASGLPMRAAGTSRASGSGNSRSALTTQGLGTFQGADFTLTAYGCYRSGTRVLCDFDIVKGRGAQMGLRPFYNVTLVDDGGKINRRHSAYYMATDGTQMGNAYLSSSPVRYIMEYDDIAAQVNSGSLVEGRNQIPNVPITTESTSPQATSSK
jgi:hypothetical protein